MSAQAAAMMQLQQLLGATNGKVPYVHAAMRGFGDTAVTDPNTWSDPYSNQPAGNPPLVSIPDNSPTAGGSSTAATLGTAAGNIAHGLFSMFSSPQTPVVQSQPVPLWAYALIGVGGLVAVGFVARSLRKPRRAVAGYRRRHHRR